MLLDAGADVNAQVQFGDYGTALIAAARLKNAGVVKLLLEAGADVNAQAKSGKYGTALIAAAWSENAEVVKLLLEAGADADAQTKIREYVRALIEAAQSRNAEVVKLLLESIVDAHMQVDMGSRRGCRSERENNVERSLILQELMQSLLSHDSLRDLLAPLIEHELD